VAQVTNAEKLLNHKEMGGNGEKDGYCVGIPEMGICTGIVVLVDNYTVN
jgi:hypothetical protein